MKVCMWCLFHVIKGVSATPTSLPFILNLHFQKIEILAGKATAAVSVEKKKIQIFQDLSWLSYLFADELLQLTGTYIAGANAMTPVFL